MIKDNLKISIVLCTYNGEKYILELLNSLYRQTRKVDELIIADDCSNDNTLCIINEFKSANDINIIIIRNQKSKGAKRNFIETSLLANGNVIFWCDQDDVWEERKVEKMIEVLKKFDSCKMLCCNLKPMYMNKPSFKDRLSLNNQRNTNKLEKIKCSSRNIGIQRSGCTMCFKKEYFLQIYPRWIDTWYHDDFIWKSAILDEVGYIYNYLGVYRRIHGDNASVHIKRSRKKRIDEIKEEIVHCEILYDSKINNKVDKEKKDKCLLKFIEFENKRIEVLEKKDLVKVIVLAAFNWNLYRGKGQLLMDIYMVING